MSTKFPPLTSSKPCALSPTLSKLLFTSIEKFDGETDLLKLLKCYVVKKETSRKTSKGDSYRAVDITYDMSELRDACMERCDIFHIIVYFKLLLCAFESANLRVQSSLTRLSFLECPTVLSLHEFENFSKTRREKQISDPLCVESPRALVMVGEAELNGTTVFAKSLCIGWLTGLVLNSKGTFYMECRIDGEQAGKSRIGWTIEGSSFSDPDDLVGASTWMIDEDSVYLPSEKQPMLPKPKRDDESMDHRRRAKSKGGRPHTQLNNRIRWQSGDTLGMLINTESLSLTFWCNGTELISTTYSSDRSLMPFFVCEPGSTLIFNIGQAKFAFPPKEFTAIKECYRPTCLQIGRFDGGNLVTGTLQWQIEPKDSFTLELVIMNHESYPSGLVFRSGDCWLRQLSGVYYFGVGEEQLLNSVSCPVSSGDRCRLSVTYSSNSSQTNLYVNGQLADSNRRSTTRLQLSPVCVLGGGESTWFTVYMAMMWDREVPQETLFVSASRGTVTEGMLSWFVFDEGTGGTIFDKSARLSNASLSGAFEWLTVSEPDVPLSLPFARDGKNHAAIISASAAYDLILNEKDDRPVLRAIADVALYLIISSSRYLELFSYSDLRAIRHLCPTSKALFSPSFQTLMLMNSCLLHFKRLGLSSTAPAFARLLSESLLSSLRCCMMVAKEEDNLKIVGLQHSRRPTSEFKNSIFVNTVFLNVLHFLSDSTCSASAAGLISSCFDIFLPFLFDQIHLLGYLLKIRNEDLTTSSEEGDEIFESLRNSTASARDFILDALCRELSRHVKALRVIGGSHRPLQSNSASKTDGDFDSRPGRSIIPALYDYVSLTDPQKHDSGDIESEGKGIVVGIVNDKDAISVLWPNGIMRCYPIDELTFHVKSRPSEEAPLVGLSDVGAPVPFEDVHRSLTFGVGEHSKESVLDFLRLNSSKEFKFKYKLNRPLSALKAMYSLKEVIALYKSFIDSDVDHEKDGMKTASPVFNSILEINLDELLRLLAVDAFNHPRPTSGSAHLLVTWTSILSGSACDFEGALRVPTMLELTQASFQSTSGTQLDYNADEDSWTSVVGEPDGVLIRHRVLSNLRFDSRRTAAAISLGSERRSATQSALKSWKSCICTVSLLPDSGTYTWYVSVDSLGGSGKGMVMLGVAEADADTENFLGSDMHGWGVTSNREAYHAGAQIPIDSPPKMSAGNIICVTYDSCSGELFFSAEVESSKKHKVFTGLKGKVLYPSFSLYSNGDSLTLLGGDRYAKADSKQLSFLGPPNPCLCSALKHTLQAMASSVQPIPEMLTNPVFYVSIPQMLSALIRCQKPLQYGSPSQDTTNLLLEAVKCMQLIQNDAVSAAFAKGRYLMRETLARVKSLLACYAGRVCSELIRTSECVDGSLRLRKELELFKDTFSDGKFVDISRLKYKSLFRVRLQARNPTYDLIFEKDDLLKWISHYSSVHTSLRSRSSPFGWPVMKSMFMAAIHVIDLEITLELLLAHTKNMLEEEWEAFRQHSPPAFLCSIWNIVENALLAAETSISQPLSGDTILKRLQYVLNFEPSPIGAEAFHQIMKEFLGGRPLSNDAAHTSLVLGSMKERISSLKAFAFDDVPLHKISASLSMNADITFNKIEGLRAARCFLSCLEGSNTAKRAMLVFLPQAFRSHGTFNLFQTSSNTLKSATTSRREHYTHGTYGSSTSALTALKGSFISIYEYLVEEFDSSSRFTDDEQILILVNAIAQVLHEEDHDLLAKVDIFSKLKNFTIGSDGESEQNRNPKITRAALKAFFLLTFQVAQTQESRSYSLAQRTRSGPITLTKSVFDILYQLIVGLSANIKPLMPPAFLKSGFFMKKLDPLSDNIAIIDDTASLLLSLSKHSACQRLLSSAAWLVTLFEFCVYSFIETQLKILQVLQHVVPHVSLTPTFPKMVVEPLIHSCFGESLAFENDFDGLMEILWALSFRVYLTDTSGTLIYSESKVSASEAPISRCISAVASEAKALIRCLLNSSSQWSMLIQDNIRRSLRETGDRASKSSFFRQLVILNAMGGHTDGFYPGSLAKDCSSGRIYEVVDFPEGSDLIRVLAEIEGVHSEFTIPSSNAIAVEKYFLHAEALSVDLMEDLIKFYVATFKGSCTHIPYSVANPITIDESWLVDTWYCSVLKSLCHLLAICPSLRSRLFDSLFDPNTSMDLHTIILATFDGLNDDMNAISSSESLLPGNTVGILHKGRRGMFQGEISSQSENCFDVKLNYGGHESSVPREFIYPLGEPLPLKIKRKALNNAGVKDIPVIEEYMESCVLRVLSTGCASFFSDQPKREPALPAIETPRPEFTKVESIDLTRVTSRSNWLRSMLGEGRQDSRGSADEAKIEQLVQMGFSRNWAQVALDLHGGDFESALTYILNNGSSLSSLPEDEEEALLETAAAEEFMRHIEELQQENERVIRKTDVMASDAPKEFYYDDRRIHIVPLYSSPSFTSDKVGSLFPSDSLYVFEELVLGPRDEWLKVRLSDYEDDYEAAESESPFAWVPRFIENVEVIFPGCASDSHGNLADPPAEMYLHDALYEIIGSEGVILRDGIDLTSRELRVIRFGSVVRCDKETINFDGTLRLHIIHPYIGWISKKRHLVKKLSTPPSDANAAAKVESGIKRSELDLLLDNSDNSNFDMYSEDRFRKESRYFDTAQGTQFRPYRGDRSSRDRVVEQRLRVSGSESYKAMQADLASKNRDAAEEILCTCANALNTLYWREILVCIFDEAYTSEARMRKLLTGFLVSSNPEEKMRSVIGSVIKFLLCVCYNCSSSCYSYGNVLLSSFPFEVEFPSVESRLLSVFCKLLCLQDSEKTRQFQVSFIDALLNELARHIRLASGMSYLDHCWTDDTSRLAVLEKDVGFRPSVSFAEWLSTLVFTCNDQEAMVTVFKVWLVALRSCNSSLRHVALLNLNSGLNHLQKKRFSDSSYEVLLKRCLALVPLRILKEETGRRLWAEQEDYPLFSRCVQAMLQFTANVEALSTSLLGTDPISERSSNSMTLVFSHEGSSLSLGGMRDMSGSWTVEFWVQRHIAVRITDEPTASGVSQSEAAECDSDSSENEWAVGSKGVVRREAGDDSSENHIRHATEYLLSSNTGAIKIQAGGRVLSIDDDPEQMTNPVEDAALCVGISNAGSERVFNCAVPAGEWVHLAISYVHKTNSVSLYVNGDLKDTVNLRISLPCSTIGSHEGSRSFTGELAEMRIWSYPRSAGEIKRDMFKDVLGYKGLLALLRCGNDCVEDKGSSGLNCQPQNCTFKFSETAPVMVSTDLPAFVFSELENAEGLYGESLGNSKDVVEATGIFSRSSFPDAADPFGVQSKEVMRLCYRVDASSQLLGYIEWCARGGTRCLIVGNVVDKKVRFTTGASSAIIGSPSEVEWIDALTFEGLISDNIIEGSVDIRALLPGLPSLLPGQARFDRKHICRHISVNASGNCVTNEDPDGGYHICAVSLQPYISTDVNECLRKGSGCFWLDFFINFNGSENSIAFGLCDYDIDSCGDVKPGSCILYSSGFIYFGSDVFEAETFVGGDVISLEIDADNGRLTFYKNSCFVYRCDSLKEMGFFDRGFRPFVSLSSIDDSVTLAAEKKGKVSLTFPDNDPTKRKTLLVNVVNGGLNGRGCLSYKDRPGYWLGRWDHGVQNGIHLWIDFDDSHREVLLEAHEFIDGTDERTLSESERAVCLEVNEWLALRPSISTYVEGSRRVTSTTRHDVEGVAAMMTQSTAEYILEIVLESGATVRSGVDIDRSPEVRKLMHGDVVEAYSKLSTDENVQRFEISDGYISERLRDTNQALVAKTLRHLFRRSERYKVSRKEGANVFASWNTDGEAIGVYDFGSSVDVVEMRLVSTADKEFKVLRLDPSSRISGWVRDEDIALLSSLLPSDLQAELHRKATIRNNRKHSKSASPPIKQPSQTTGTMRFSAHDLFLLSGGHPDMVISPDFSSVTLAAENTRALVLGSKGFSRGVHYW